MSSSLPSSAKQEQERTEAELQDARQVRVLGSLIIGMGWLCGLLVLVLPFLKRYVW